MQNNIQCDLGYTKLETLVGTKCYKCSDPSIIPEYILPDYTPSTTNYKLSGIGSNGKIIVDNPNETSETVIPNDIGKVVCNLKPFVFYGPTKLPDNTWSTITYKKNIQCDGNAKLTSIKLPSNVQSTWSNTNIEPRCQVVLPF